MCVFINFQALLISSNVVQSYLIKSPLLILLVSCFLLLRVAAWSCSMRGGLSFDGPEFIPCPHSSPVVLRKFRPESRLSSPLKEFSKLVKHLTSKHLFYIILSKDVCSKTNTFQARTFKTSMPTLFYTSYLGCTIVLLTSLLTMLPQTCSRDLRLI